VKLAIIGAGMTGAYLYRLLDKRSNVVHIFDKRPGTKCGISPCAWGTSRGFKELIAATGLDPLNYILRPFEYVIMDGIKIKADLMTFDKQRLIQDLLGNAVIRRSLPQTGKYDRVIDSTGVSRALLPPLHDDIILSCVQYRIKAGMPMENKIKLGRVGYSWCFPLSGNEYHIGCGSLDSNPRKVLKDLGWAEQAPIRRISCSCMGKIRITAPLFSQPFVIAGSAVQTWGVGEAIGCVAPLAGDGIVPGMKSVQILLEHWDNPLAYTKALLREFKWMTGERKVIDKLRSGEALRLGDAWVLRKNSRRMGMEVGVKEAVFLLQHLR
jgi:flavin-dependent dehydrogenase